MCWAELDTKEAMFPWPSAWDQGIICNNMGKLCMFQLPPGPSKDISLPGWRATAGQLFTKNVVGCKQHVISKTDRRYRVREKNYPDPDKKIIFNQDWLRFFGKKKRKLDIKEPEHRD
jgi:hypothetical protein